MSAADNIAAVLGGKRNGSGWMARCPCHMDNNASLSISEGSDGKALLKCHAGCRQDELMARVRGMGLDLGGRRPASADVATYDYRDRNGTVRSAEAMHRKTISAVYTAVAASRRRRTRCHDEEHENAETDFTETAHVNSPV